MDARGRKPIPTAVRELRGTLQPCRTNPREPKISPGEPPIPELVGSDPVALAEWRRIAFFLVPAGVLTPADAGILTAAAISWSRYLAAVAEYRAAGITVEAGNGGALRKHPAVATAHEAFRDYQLASAELGLTPSARSRVQALPVENDRPRSMLDD